METAAGIAQEIDVKQIHINYRCGEWLRQEFYQEGCPFNEILINDDEHRIIEEFYLNRICVDHDKTYKSECAAHYPETRQDVIDRIKGLGCDLAKEDKYDDEKIAHIVCTHGINVRSLAQLAYDETQETSLTEPKVKNVIDIPYCGISAAQIKGKTWNIIFGGKAEYLAD